MNGEPEHTGREGMTLLGMAPLCWAQAYLADGILRAIPQLLYPLLVLCAIYAVVVLWIVARLCKPGEAARP